jgi:hypothetical protein
VIANEYLLTIFDVILKSNALQMIYSEIGKMLCLLLMAPRKRRQIALRIDEGILEILSKLAKSDNTSVNKYIEKHFLDYGKKNGLLPEDFELLGETRGGDRKSIKNTDD